MKLAVIFGACLLISGVAIRLGIALASHFGIVDRPGGHKLHDTGTPFVGGFGLIAVLISVPLLDDCVFGDFALFHLPAILVGGLVIFLTGLADDLWHLGFKPRFLVEALVALAMVFIGGVELGSLGELFPGVRVELGWLAVPLTVFATVGLINALNMIDGIDGLSGSVSLVSLGLAAIVAQGSADSSSVIFIVALMGGVSGFLYYNLRYPGNGRARVFLGDNGSMLLGFLFAWLLISMSQGGEKEQAAMTPVTALWLFALPLMDTVGVMLRRIWLGQSPFRPDRHHLHHLFVRAGFRVCDVVLIAAAAQLALGLIGLGGLLLGVPEYLMFWLFLAVFAGYFLLTLRPWRLVPWLRRLNRSLGLPSVQVRGIFVGYLCREKCREVLAVISAGLGEGYDYQLSVHQAARSSTDEGDVYCVVHIPAEGNDRLIGKIRRDTARIKRGLAGRPGIEVRLFLCRQGENDQRTRYTPVLGGGSRDSERRGERATLIYSMERGQRTGLGEAAGFDFSVPPGYR